jgi:carboxylesterase
MGSLIEPAVPAVPASAAGLRKNDVAKPDQDERAYRWVPTKAASSLLRQLPDLRRRLPSLDVPVLVVRSLQDHCVTPENSLALLGLLAMARAEDLPLERSFHIATMDHDLPLVSETAAEFVARVEKKRATDAA